MYALIEDSLILNSESFFFFIGLVFLISLSIPFPLTNNSIFFLDVSIRLRRYDLDRALRRAYSLYYGKIRYPFFFPDLPPLLPFRLHSALPTRSGCLCRISGSPAECEIRIILKTIYYQTRR